MLFKCTQCGGEYEAKTMVLDHMLGIVDGQLTRKCRSKVRCYNKIHERLHEENPYAYPMNKLEELRNEKAIFGDKVVTRPRQPSTPLDLSDEERAKRSRYQRTYYASRKFKNAKYVDGKYDTYTVKELEDIMAEESRYGGTV